jgi:hypothetical protein
MGVKNFLRNDFMYYSALFLRSIELADQDDGNFPHLYYNDGLNDMESQYMLILAACKPEDDGRTRDQKIFQISKALDKAYVILQLNRAYDSNRFQEIAYGLNQEVQNCTQDDIESVIDSAILNEINERKNAEFTSLLSFQQFRDVGYGDYNPRFMRYFFTRVEEFICNGLNQELQDTLHNYVRGTGRTNAYHIEHILARNDQNKALFVDGDGNIDEELFERQRNRIGGLLLLKGRDNESSGNEIYTEKLKTYTGSAPYWAQTLVKDFYKSNISMRDFIANSGFDFKAIPKVFDSAALEYRSELLFEIVRRIWNID